MCHPHGQNHHSTLLEVVLTARTVARELIMWCHYWHFNKYSSTNLRPSGKISRWSKNFPNKFPVKTDVAFASRRICICFAHKAGQLLLWLCVKSWFDRGTDIVCVIESDLWCFQTQTSATSCNTIQQNWIILYYSVSLSFKIMFLKWKQQCHDTAMWSLDLKELSQPRYSSDITGCRPGSARS